MKPIPSAPTPPEPALTRRLRQYLYVTAAVLGGVIMLVEILGAKMLAPYMGTSHFVWVAQIGVTLVALAVGYYLGGRLGDRQAGLGGLYSAHLVAAIWLCGTVLLSEPVAFWALQFSLPVATVAASLILFFLPLTLMAMTGPFLIRSVAESLARVGGSVGRLSAVSTLGSFLGTVLIGYILIPLLPNSTTMLLSAALLAAVASLYFGVWERRGPRLGFLAVTWLAIGLSALGASRVRWAQLQGARELFRGNSHFGMLQVVETGDGTRWYLNDFLTQNTYDPERGQSSSLFTYMLAELARGYTPELKSALCIGMGIGIVPMDLARSGVEVDVVEINPAVLPVAEEYFDFERERVGLTFSDGRHFLNRVERRYDTIVLDAFLGDSSPSHLMTREAFAAMQRALNPGGTLVINSFGGFHSDADFFTAALRRTLGSVFAQVRIHASGNGNVFFVASDAPELHLRGQPDVSAMHPDVRRGVEVAWQRTLAPPAVETVVLTDDFNPVEFYDAANREELRKHLTFGMRPR